MQQLWNYTVWMVYENEHGLWVNSAWSHCHFKHLLRTWFCFGPAQVWQLAHELRSGAGISVYLYLYLWVMAAPAEETGPGKVKKIPLPTFRKWNVDDIFDIMGRSHGKLCIRSSCLPLEVCRIRQPRCIILANFSNQSIWFQYFLKTSGYLW